MNTTTPFAAFSSALETWMSAHRRMTESLVNDAAVEQVRRRGAGMLNGGVDVMTSASGETASIFADQAKFMGRLMERSFDCLFGAHAARSPEALAATSRDIMTDFVDNAVASSERVVKLGTRNLESIHALLSSAVPADRKG